MRWVHCPWCMSSCGHHAVVVVIGSRAPACATSLLRSNNCSLSLPQHARLQAQLKALDAKLTGHINDLTAAGVVAIGVRQEELIASVRAHMTRGQDEVIKAVRANCIDLDALASMLAHKLCARTPEHTPSSPGSMELTAALAGGAGAVGTPSVAPGPPVIHSADVTLGRVLDKGAYGTVHAGEWTLMDEPVAVKMLTLDSHAVTAEEVLDFLAEAALLKAIRHANIVSVYGVIAEEVDTPAPRVGIVMELLTGSVYKALRDNLRTFSTRQLLGILRQAAFGVAFLHAHDPPIVHGDLKSLNILLDKDGRAKVCHSPSASYVVD